MRDEFTRTLSSLFTAIREANIAWLESERPSCREGIFVWFASQLKLTQSLGLIPACDPTGLDSTRFTEAPYLAALAFYIDSGKLPEQEFKMDWRQSLSAILDREPFTGDRRSFGYQSFVLLGLTFAVLKFLPSGVERAKLQQIVADRRAYETSDLHHWICVRLAAHRLGVTIPASRIDDNAISQTDRAMVLLVGALYPDQIASWIPIIDIQKMRNEFLIHACLDDPRVQPGLESLLIYAALEWTTRQKFAADVDPLGTVHKVLEGFEAALERWPVRWDIGNEADVQGILYLMVKPLFPDLVYEDPLPKSGIRSTRPDFGIRSLRLAIEAKYIYKATDFGKVQADIESDSVSYFANHGLYDRFVVFVYDASRTVERHQTFRSGIEKLSRVAGVYIVSAPGRLVEREASGGKTKTKRKVKK